MDEHPLQYSRHARRRMRRLRISEDDVEEIVWCPADRVVTGSAVEHYGYLYDGRKCKVVTNKSETIVTTVMCDKEPRPRVRHNKR
jgi:hypothetical protein